MSNACQIWTAPAPKVSLMPAHALRSKPWPAAAINQNYYPGSLRRDLLEPVNKRVCATAVVPHSLLVRAHTKGVMQTARFLEGFLEGSLTIGAS